MKFPIKSLFTICACAFLATKVQGAAAIASSASATAANTAVAAPVPMTKEKPAPAMSNPRSVAIDKDGNLFVADTTLYIVYKITPAGKFSVYAGQPEDAGSADGPVLKASFGGIAGVAVDAVGNVYVADTDSDTVRKISVGGNVTTLAGKAGGEGSTDGIGEAARFSGPTSVAVDAAGNVYVADDHASLIRKISPAGVVTTLAGKAGASGSTDGTGADARFSGPRGIAIDREGNLYVADEGNSNIRKITPAGVVTTLAGKAGTSGNADGTGTNATFSGPRGLAVDKSGNVYVTDTDNSLIRKITPAGVVTTLAGKAGQTGKDDGAGDAARFEGPRGAAVDADGNIYVADSDNGSIRKITPAGVVTTLVNSAAK